ncbi:BrnT family toxin [Candidatus Saccharibacteria bacterium]|jgi:uncharacterized DUF497 family protein|nr:BrnT family toxin [Candidatus Saccharibacteria bacterium]
MPLIEYYGLLFEWHDKKMEIVYRGREITFEEVCSVFLDSYALTASDVGHYDEPRMITVGMSDHARLLTVVWVERGDTIRIITAFEPTLTHKRRYEYERRS